MKKIFTILFTLLAFASAKSQSSTVVISQVYGGGGGTGTYLYDYVELHNVSTITQDISGFKLMYGSATGIFATTASNSYTFPTSTTIPSGGYLLIQTGSVGTSGAAFPLSADLITSNLSMSGSSGKVALVISTFAINTCGSNAATCTPTQLNSFIDWVAYGAAGNGTAGNGEGGTSVNNGSALTSSQGCVRKLNGCQDNNNNNLDFNVVTAPAPRNSTSLVSICSSPTITASPNIAAITTTLGVASASQSYNLSASNLTPAAGDITITPTTGLEISFNNSTFFTTPQTIAYNAGTLASTPIYVRIAASASQGALTGASVTNSGGGSTNAVITVAGGVFKNYYSNASGNLSATATWGDDLLGTMNAPADFSTPFCLYNVVNRVTPAQLGAPWDVTATGSRIIVGQNNTIETTPTDSIKATNFVELLDNSKIIIGNKIAPSFTILGLNSTVEYSYAGTTVTDTVKINNTAYHNLTLKNGLKYLKSGTTIVNGELLIDGTANMNGAGSPFSTIVLKGNLTMNNGAIIEDSTTGFANRFTLNMAGNSLQKINTGTSELRIFRLQRDTTVGLSDVTLEVFPSSKICIGNASGGDLKLTQKISGTPTFTTMTMGADAQLAIVKNGSIFTDANGKAGVLSTTDANITINKSTTSATINPGTLKFTPGSSLKDFTVNITTPTKDSVIIANNILINNSLNLTKGVIVMAAGQTLETSDLATITGGSATSYVDGLVKRNFTTPTQTLKLFPVGKNKQYSPVEITSAINNNYTVQYFKQAYSNTTVNATTLATTPGYNISGAEYWDIAQGSAGSCDIKYYYNTTSGVVDATQVSIAHFNGTDWDNIGRTSNGTDAAGTFISLSGISSFSPFTFGGTAAVLPIVLELFEGNIANNVSTLQWKASCENIGDTYILQYSNDGINFVNIYNVNAIGNCNGNLYSYKHSKVVTNVNYYRLALQASNGSIKYSNIITLKNSPTHFETKMISNTNQIGLSINAIAKDNAVLNIVNANGQKIMTQNILFEAGTQIKYLQTSTWSKGVYFATFTTNDGIVKTMQFVK